MSLPRSLPSPLPFATPIVQSTAGEVMASDTAIATYTIGIADRQPQMVMATESPLTTNALGVADRQIQAVAASDHAGTIYAVAVSDHLM